ncbi:lysophospholipid acyltransferase family protein [Calothrix sp. 336/3]|uniref:lysophospholipid acyltransferase family protein n=1 Tax=Calothrix sp. 336/3 TaxID=1337936 RepID=UPI000557965D|nr:1-acyl-sn-glycerol-3-phosphate acyltransferase [Calothrix sp. 336/3]AKG24190.1 glycerol acyltransferase [Calothrix sp. 336/3]
MVQVLTQPIPLTKTQEFILPPVTAETIQRAKEGMMYARDRHTNEMIQTALTSAESVTPGTQSQKINGKIRQLVLRVLIRALFRVRVENPENIPTTPAVIAANHLNHIDPFLLLSELSTQSFYHVLGDARTLYNSAWKRLLLGFTKGVIPLERIWKEEMAVIEAAKAGRDDLADLAAEITEYVPKGNSIENMRRIDRIVQGIFQRGDSILLFPEGRLGNQEGQLLPLKRGAVIYALRSGVPIVPIALVGTKDLYLRKELTLKIGKPLMVKQSHRPKAQEIQTVIDELQAALLELLPQNYQEPKEPKPLQRFLNHLFW